MNSNTNMSREEYRRQHEQDEQTIKRGSFWLSFLLGIALLILALGATLKLTVLDPDFVTDNVVTDETVSQLQKDLNSSVAAQGRQYGLPASATENLLTKKQIRNDMKIALTNLWDGKENFVPTDQISQQVTQNIGNVAESTASSALGSADSEIASQVADQAKTKAASAISSQLKNSISSNPQVAKIPSEMSRMKSLISGIFIAGAIASAIMLIVTILSVKAAPLWACHYIGIAGLWSGLVGWLVCQGGSALKALLPGEGLEADIAGKLIQGVASQGSQLCLYGLVAGLVLTLVGLLRKRRG